MPVIIAEETLYAARLSPGELKQEIAVLLFNQNRLTLGQASHLAELPLLRFQHLLASRDIPVHYDIADFEADLATLSSWRPGHPGARHSTGCSPSPRRWKPLAWHR